MNQDKKVSLIVAIYKSENYIDKLINSITNQTYRNIEIILVNDGSPDNCGRICGEYSLKDSRIIVIHKKNGGTCEARNYGLKVVTGEYIMIIDGDDWLELDCVEYMMRLVCETKSDMGFSDKVFTTRDRVQIKYDEIETWSSEDATAAILYPNMEIGPWNKIYRTKLLKDNNITFSVPWFGEGLYFASTAAQHSNQVGVGHKKVYNYRLNNLNSGLTNYKVQNGINALNNINSIKDKLQIRTSKVINAAEWHIWKNYNFLLLQIIGTNSKQEYNDVYQNCLWNIRILFPKVFIKSKVNLKERLKILIGGMFPVFYANLAIMKNRRNLKLDVME